MDQNDSVEIRQVINGYFVHVPYDVRNGGDYIRNNQVLVFQTFAELSNWLKMHFTHRNSFIDGDGE